MGGGMSLAELSIWQCLSLGIEYYWPGCVFLAFFRAAHGRKCNGGVVELCESIAMSMALSVMVRYAGDKYSVACIDDDIIRIVVEFVLACVFGAITIYEADKTREDTEELHEQKTPTIDSAIGPATSDCIDRHDIDPVGEREAMSGIQLGFAVEFLHREQIRRARTAALTDLSVEQYTEAHKSNVAADGGRYVLCYQGTPVRSVSEDGILRVYDTNGACLLQQPDDRVASVKVADTLTVTEIW